MAWLIGLWLWAPITIARASETPPDAESVREGTVAATEEGSEARARQVAPEPGLPPEPVLRRYLHNREDEDWRWLAGGASMPDRFDRLKYVRVGERTSLGFGGEVRARTEWVENRSWGFGPAGPGTGPDEDTHLLTRARVHADLRVGEHFRVFGQLQAAGSDGRDGGPRPSIDRDSLGLQQLFAEVGLPGGSALRVGRQELSFGVGRLISVRAGPINVRQPQDGLRWILRRGEWRADVFAVRVVDTRPGLFDDSSSEGAELFGVYLTRGRPYVSPRGLELYLFRTDRDTAAYFSGVGREERASLGARAWLRAGGWSHDVEGVWQFGSFAPFGPPGREGDIEAWALSTLSTREFSGAWRPTLELATGFNSGDRDAADGDLGTFVAPLPRGGYFGQFAPFGPGNLQGARLSLVLHPRRALTVTAGVYGFWRHAEEDGLYGVSGFPLLPPLGIDNYVGLQPELSLAANLGRHLELEVALARFDAASALRAAGARDITSAGISLRALF